MSEKLSDENAKMLAEFEARPTNDPRIRDKTIQEIVVLALAHLDALERLSAPARVAEAQGAGSGHHPERKLGERDGLRYAITWLHERAKSMRDPRATSILNSAAFDLGLVVRDHKSKAIRVLPIPTQEVSDASEVSLGGEVIAVPKWLAIMLGGGA